MPVLPHIPNKYKLHLNYILFLSIFIHVVVVLLVITRGHVVHPFLVLEIPFHSLLDSLLKLERWLPAEFLLELTRINGVTHIVTLSICYISDEVHILAFLSAEQSVNGLDYHLDDVDVLPLVETADVIGLGYLTLVENHIDGTGMIHYIQPVAHVLTLTIYWQWLAMTDVVDDQMFLTLYFHHSIALSTVGAMS